ASLVAITIPENPSARPTSRIACVREGGAWQCPQRARAGPVRRLRFAYRGCKVWGDDTCRFGSTCSPKAMSWVDGVCCGQTSTPGGGRSRELHADGKSVSHASGGMRSVVCSYRKCS